MQPTTISPADALLARLEDPATSQALNTLLDQLPLLAFGVQALNGFVARGDSLTENIAEQMSEFRKTEALQGVRGLGSAVPGLVKASVQLGAVAERPAFDNLLSPEMIDEFGNPEKLALLRKLFDKLDLIVFAIEAVEGFLARGDSLVEGIHEGFRDATKMAPSVATVAQLQSLWKAAPSMLEAASALAESGVLKRADHLVDVADRLLDSGMLEPETVEVIAEMGATLTETMKASKASKHHPKETIGIFGLLGTLKDPDIQVALSFFLNFSRSYGKKLRDAGYA